MLASFARVVSEQWGFVTVGALENANAKRLESAVVNFYLADLRTLRLSVADLVI